MAGEIGHAGSNLCGKINNCYSTGNVSGTNPIGLAIGYIDFGDAKNIFTTKSGTIVGGGRSGYYGATNCINFLNYSLEEKVRLLGVAFTSMDDNDGLPKLIWEIN